MKRIVRGQRIDSEKLAFARVLRNEMTPAETLLWSHLRGSRVAGMHFRRQQVIHGFIADFYCNRHGVVIELDGPIHDLQVEYDLARDAAFEGLGLRVLRFRNEEVLNDPERVLRTIAASRGEPEGGLPTASDLTPQPPSL